MKPLSILFLAGALLATACTSIRTYAPRESQFDMKNIPPFSTQRTVSLLKGQSETQQVLLAQLGGSQFNTELNKWTEVAISTTERELTKRGATVSAGADRSLTLSVTSAKLTSGGWGFRGYVDLHMKTGSGYETTFSAEAPAANLFNAADGALARAVVRMLSDAKVISYLSE